MREGISRRRSASARPRRSRSRAGAARAAQPAQGARARSTAAASAGSRPCVIFLRRSAASERARDRPAAARGVAARGRGDAAPRRRRRSAGQGDVGLRAGTAGSYALRRAAVDHDHLAGLRRAGRERRDSDRQQARFC